MTDHPGLDRLPPHRQHPVQIGPDDAVMECEDGCPACAVLFSLDRFYQEADA